MSEAETRADATTTSDDEQQYCYGHPERATRLNCTRCGKPICGQCAIPASVGQHCPWCVAEARKQAPKVRSAMRAQAPAVVTIVVVNVVFFLLQRLVPQLTQELFLFRPAIAAGEWYRLLTPLVLHGSLLHLGLNAYVLWVYGPYVEQAVGTARFVASYLVAGLAASALSYALGPCATPSVGASGAIFGIVGFLLTYLYRRRTSTFVGQFLSGLVLFVGINLLFGFVVRGIDNFAHIGGLLGGLALGAGWNESRGPRASAATWSVAAVVVVAASVALIVVRTSVASCAVVPL